eukprot:gene88-4337_t
MNQYSNINTYRSQLAWLFTKNTSETEEIKITKTKENELEIEHSNLSVEAFFKYFNIQQRIDKINLTNLFIKKILIAEETQVTQISLVLWNKNYQIPGQNLFTSLDQIDILMESNEVPKKLEVSFTVYKENFQFNFKTSIDGNFKGEALNLKSKPVHFQSYQEIIDLGLCNKKSLLLSNMKFSEGINISLHGSCVFGKLQVSEISLEPNQNFQFKDLKCTLKSGTLSENSNEIIAQMNGTHHHQSDIRFIEEGDSLKSTHMNCLFNSNELMNNEHFFHNQRTFEKVSFPRYMNTNYDRYLDFQLIYDNNCQVIHSSIGITKIWVTDRINFEILKINEKSFEVKLNWNTYFSKDITFSLNEITGELKPTTLIRNSETRIERAFVDFETNFLKLSGIYKDSDDHVIMIPLHKRDVPQMFINNNFNSMFDEHIDFEYLNLSKVGKLHNAQFKFQ